jgi:hypothetical protein
MRMHESRCYLESNIHVGLLVNPTKDSISDEVSKFETYDIKYNEDAMIIEKFM